MGDKKLVMAVIFCIIIIMTFEYVGYDMAGYVFAFLFLCAILMIQIYKYNEKKHQLSDINFKLKRDNFLFHIINFYILGKTVYDRDFQKILEGGFTITDAFVDIMMLTCLLIQVYMCIAHKPILSTEGFLCSNGCFIKFSDITSIISEDRPLFKHKRITVAYKPDDSIVFKVSNSDYENIKRHINFYGLGEIKELMK